MATEGSLDFKAMFEQVNEAFLERLALEDERGKLYVKIDENSDSSTCAITNINRMKLPDQVALLRIIVKQYELCKELCEKYNYFEGDVDDLQTM